MAAEFRPLREGGDCRRPWCAVPGHATRGQPTAFLRPPRRARDASCCLCMPGTRLSHDGDSKPLFSPHFGPAPVSQARWRTTKRCPTRRQCTTRGAPRQPSALCCMSSTKRARSGSRPRGTGSALDTTWTTWARSIAACAMPDCACAHDRARACSAVLPLPPAQAKAAIFSETK